MLSGKDRSRTYPSRFPFELRSRVRTVGTGSSWRTTVNRSFPTDGRLTVSCTFVPSSPLIRKSERSKATLSAGTPSIDTITSPRRIPASRAGPRRAEVTTSPSLEGPTVSPTPE